LPGDGADERAADHLDAVAAVVGAERGDPAVELDGQREVTRVVEEVLTTSSRVG
jgi:hypothetical protein